MLSANLFLWPKLRSEYQTRRGEHNSILEILSDNSILKKFPYKEISAI